MRGRFQRILSAGQDLFGNNYGLAIQRGDGVDNDDQAL